MNINSRTSKINFAGFASGDIASFTGLRVAPIKVRSQINAIQSGSGTPAPDNIRPIIGVSECNVVRCGTNVWDEEWESGYWKVTTGEPVANPDYIRCKNFILVKPNTTFCLGNSATSLVKNEVLFFDIDKNLLNPSYTDVKGNATFTTPANCYFIKFYMNINYGGTYNNDISFNYPSTDTAYHAYTGNTYPIALGDTYYGGSLDVTTGVLTVTWKGGDIKDFDWQYSQTLGYFSVELADSETGTASDIPNIKTSVFETIPYNERTQHSNVVIDLRNQAKYVEVRNAGYTDVTAFKQAFAGQTLIYKLATPITVQLTPTQIEQLLGANNIFSDTGNVEVYYVTI